MTTDPPLPESTGGPEPAAQSAIAAVWVKSRPLVRRRLDGIVAAAESIAGGRADQGLIAEARRISHNLAGMLGVFGFSGASTTASALEHCFIDHESGGPATEVLTLALRLKGELDDALADTASPSTSCSQ